MDGNILKANFPEKLGVLFEPHRYKIIYGGRGAGRCFAKGTKVVMFNGPLKKVEDVVPGDLLMGPDSKQRTVMGTTFGTDMMYDIQQAGGGMSYTVNGDHVLSVKKSHAFHMRRRDGKIYPTTRYPNDPDILNIPVKEWQAKSEKFKTFYFGYKTESINFPPQKASTIDPYFLGLWFGDGTSRELRLTVHEDDQEIIDYCMSYAMGFGNTTSVCVKNGVRAFDVGFPPPKGAYRNQIWGLFIGKDLKNNKHIPEEYFTASENERLSLLAGLIDSDGYQYHNGYEFTNTNKELAFGAKRIADLLGFKTSQRVKKANGKDRLQDSHIISITGDVWRIPSLLPRKKISEDDTSKNKNFLLRSITVTEKGVGEYFGFEVDGDHLFLLEDGTVVHNSWGCARALLLKSVLTPTRVLCAREVQKSIRDSVHKLLSDQIQVLGISPLFDIQEALIKVRNGGEFTFSGLSTQTIESIKSMEGVDYVWAEEAHIITKRSWDILIPTIRKDNSEIWVTFNPSLESDETYQRFVVNPPPDTVIVKLDYHDNPWFPEVLEKERQYCQENDPENYPNIWEGQCKPAVEGAIYYHEIQRAISDNKICNVPYDPMLKVHVVMDLGWNDAMAIALVQRHASGLRIIDYIEDSHKTLDYYSVLLKEKRLNWGCVWLPHDGRNKDFKTGLSTEDIMRKLGWQVKITNNIPVEDGIRLTRMTFGRIYFDQVKTERLIECIKRYCRRINTQTQEPGSPLHNEFAHGADVLRYLCINADKFSNEDERRIVYHKGYSPYDAVVGY